MSSGTGTFTGLPGRQPAPPGRQPAPPGANPAVGDGAGGRRARWLWIGLAVLLILAIVLTVFLLAQGTDPDPLGYPITTTYELKEGPR